MARVSLEKITKAYPAAARTATPACPAVDAIDLEINSGEFMVLVGPSGCGKSTTLRMIAGLEEITSGSLRIADQRVNDVAPKDRDIAMVFQNYALYPHLSVFDNLAFGLKIRRLPRAEIATRVAAAAELLGLTPYLDRLPKALSGGQRQRVALGRAIVRQPKVFLFDEPLSNLDAQMRAATRAEISRLHTRLGATMIYVTHDQVEAMTMGDRICVMRDGRIQQVAAPLDLYEKPTNLFVASFIGSPPMNFLRGTIRIENNLTSFLPAALDSAPLPLPTSLAALAASHHGKTLTLGLRPENIHDARSPAVAAHPTLSAHIELAEPMGAETYLHLRALGQTFIARVSPEQRYHANESFRAALDLTRAHLFDPTTELRLS